MQTMDNQSQAPTGALFSPAADRNAAVILDSLKPHLPAKGRVLEIASGSGQHGVHIARALPDLEWHPSDPSFEARQSIDLWARDVALPNLRPALNVDMLDPESWPQETYDAIACINMVHISPWQATEGLMQMAAKLLPIGGLLYLYGPYREKDVVLAPSNAAFDESLKSRNPEWGLRDSRDVGAAAKKNGLHFTRRIEMPANNISLLFRRF